MYLKNNLCCIYFGYCFGILLTINFHRWQGWTNKLVPSILEIQQILVDLGDKNKSFVGSQEWIGSMEVSFVLNAHLDVTCRIMSLRQGDTLNSVCLELAEHFDRHGTPVMIGIVSYNCLIFVIMFLWPF